MNTTPLDNIKTSTDSAIKFMDAIITNNNLSKKDNAQMELFDIPEQKQSFSNETVYTFKEYVEILKMAEIHRKRIYGLLSKEFDENSYHELLRDDLIKYVKTLGIDPGQLIDNQTT